MVKICTYKEDSLALSYSNYYSLAQMLPSLDISMANSSLLKYQKNFPSLLRDVSR